MPPNLMFFFNVTGEGYWGFVWLKTQVERPAYTTGIPLRRLAVYENSFIQGPIQDGYVRYPEMGGDVNRTRGQTY